MYPMREDRPSGDEHVLLDLRRLAEPLYLSDTASEDTYADPFKNVIRGDLPLSDSAIAIRWPR